MNTESERRRYSRIAFESFAVLILDNRTINATLLDISLKGALLRLDTEKMPEAGEYGTLQVHLDDGQSRIEASVCVAYIQGQKLGLVCTGIDLDSVTHLTRLVELNLGSHELLERELSLLIE